MSPINPIFSLSSTKKPSSFYQNITVGSASGILATPIIKPFLYFSNCASTNRKIEKDIRIWYRGSLALGSSFIPAITIQYVAEKLFSQYMPPVASASFAGACSAVVVSPIELVMIQKEATNKNNVEIIKQLFLNKNISFMRGYPETALREAGFTFVCFYLSPLIKEYLNQKDIQGISSHFIAGSISGIIGGALTQPFNGRKTRLQTNLSLQESLSHSFLSKNAFKGTFGRMRVLSIACTAISILKEKVSAYLYPNPLLKKNVPS